MRRILCFVAIGLGMACASQDGTPTPPATPAEAVTFSITAPASLFAPAGEVTVSVWGKGQLDLLEQSRDCIVGIDASGKETVTCLDGKAPPAKPAPETMTVKVAELGKPIVFASKTVHVGDSFQIQVGGGASDLCNSTGASFRGVAGQKSLTLDKLDFATTTKACLFPLP